MRRKEFYTLEEASITLNNNKFYDSYKSKSYSDYVWEQLKQNNIIEINCFYCNKYKNLDNSIYLTEKNGICYFKVLFTFSCVLDCCGRVEKSEIKFSLTKLRKFFTKKIYERHLGTIKTNS